MNVITKFYNKLKEEKPLLSGTCSGISSILAAKNMNVPPILLRGLIILLGLFTATIPVLIAYIVAGAFISRLNGHETAGKEEETISEIATE